MGMPPSESARARRRLVWRTNSRARKGSMLSWKYNRQPLTSRLSFQANIATVTLRTIQTSQSESARVGALYGAPEGGDVKADRQPQYRQLEFPCQHGGSPIADKYRTHKIREHARERAGALLGAPIGGHVNAACYVGYPIGNR